MEEINLRSKVTLISEVTDFKSQFLETSGEPHFDLKQKTHALYTKWLTSNWNFPVEAFMDEISR